jgi:hypothetical protein
VTGYDPERSLIFLADPAAGPAVFPIDQFKAGWARANYFTLLAVPKSMEEATPTPKK